MSVDFFLISKEKLPFCSHFSSNALIRQTYQYSWNLIFLRQPYLEREPACLFALESWNIWESTLVIQSYG